MKNLLQKYNCKVILLAAMCSISIGLKAQLSAQIRGVKSQLETVKRSQWKQIRQLQQHAVVPKVTPKVSPVPKMPKVQSAQVSRPKILTYERLRFSGKTKAEIDSIKKLDAEKERFYTDFLMQLSVVTGEIDRRDSLSVILDDAIFSVDTVADESFTPDFLEYANDAIVGSPYEIALYNSYYDDLITRNDSAGFFGKYARIPLMESPVNANLINQIYSESVFTETVGLLRDRLNRDVEQYMSLYELDPFNVAPDSIEAVVALVPQELYEGNDQLVRALAEVSATANAVYNELRDVRSLRDGGPRNIPSLYTVRLVEMKLNLEDALNKPRQISIPDSKTMKELMGYIRQSWHMDRYNPASLHGFLKFLLKNEHETL